MPTKKPEKRPKKKTRLTIKQARLVAFLPQVRTQREAAILAGYKDCAYTRQAANRAIASIRRKAPDVLKEMGVTFEAVAYKNLLPLMNATEIKFIKNDTEFVELAALDIQLRALD